MLKAPNLNFNSPIKYDVGKIIPWAETGDMYDILSSGFLELLKTLPSAGSFRIVTEVYRPDVISYKIYGTPAFKIPLMFYNNMQTVRDCYHGRVLEFPSILDMDKLLFSL